MFIPIDVPDGTSGDWSVDTIHVNDTLGERINFWKTGRGVTPGIYKRLCRGKTCVMSNTPDEISDFYHIIHCCTGSILINGLGLGVVLKAILSRSIVTDVTVIEKSEDVIRLVAPTYMCDPRVNIICADAYTYKPVKGKYYDVVWHDIWDGICGDNVKDMTKLHRKYGRISNYQDSWCRAQCIQQNREWKKQQELRKLYRTRMAR